MEAQKSNPFVIKITEKWRRGRTEFQLFYGCVLVYSCCVIGPCIGIPEHCHHIYL